MSRTIVIAAFVAVAALFAVIGLASRREGSTIPSLGDLSGFVMRFQVGRLPVGRVALIGFWWWVGWHFFAR